MIRTLIVEDDPVPKQLYSLLIQSSEDFELAGTISNADFAEAFCTGSRVDLILMDVVTQLRASGLDAACKIKQSMPRIKIIIVTSQPEVDWIERAKEGHVDSFYYKMTEEREILDVMRRTMRGESIYPGWKPVVRLGDIVSDELTNLQIRILRELTAGKKTSEIAEALHLSEHTVNNNINDMLDKTGFSTRMELAITARESGIVIQDI